MPKGYWVIVFHSIKDEQKLEAYKKLAGPVLQAQNAKYLVRGKPKKVYERGLIERAVVVEFESLNKAIDVYESSEYQAALKVLGDGAERDVRIIEGI
ncbi:MAG: DUF1330 domain-containing protein [Spirochaetia bacterium]|nr:DUF1330 domain-containing protein [Spirochaetia bacterium]